MLNLLNGIGADLGQEVIVTRVPGGVLNVEAVVNTTQRQADILRALAPVTNDPAIKIQVETEGAQQRKLQAQSSSTKSESRTAVTTDSVVTNDSIPVRLELRQYLLTRGVSELQLDLEVGRLSNQMLMRSHDTAPIIYAIERHLDYEALL